MQGRNPAKPNNLLAFLHKIARNATSVILGTATPIQLDAVELWDLLTALNQGAPYRPIRATWARVSALSTRVGRPATPRSNGRGGTKVGLASPPFNQCTRADSSPAT